MRATIHSVMALAVVAAPSAAQGRIEVSPGVVAGNYGSDLQHDLVLSLGLSVAP